MGDRAKQWAVIAPGTRGLHVCFPAFVPAAPFAFGLLLPWSPSQRANHLHGVEARDLDVVLGLSLSLTLPPFTQQFTHAVSLTDLSVNSSHYSYGDA